jgi:signal transduction histidine kinase
MIHRLHRITVVQKLVFGFGALVVLMLLVAGLSAGASMVAGERINRTSEQRMPTALAASRAQTNLLAMFNSMRSYLVLGEERLKEQYTNADHAFQEDLQTIETLSPMLSDNERAMVQELQEEYRAWHAYPQRLFTLHDNQLQREPAYRWLSTTGLEQSSGILRKIEAMVDLQAAREPTTRNTRMLRDMARFQRSFAAMLMGLRSYATTGDDTFRYYEYKTHLNMNNEVWSQLLDQRGFMTDEQQDLLDTIAVRREAFVSSVPNRVFAVMEGERWREDLYLLKVEVEPLTENMQALLLQLTKQQQSALLHDMQAGQQALEQSRRLTILWGGLAVLLGGALALFLGRSIMRPIRQLTTVAEQIQQGNITVEAPVMTRDEIGLFAQTFNRMTGRLGEMIQQRDQLITARSDAVHAVVHDLNHTVQTLLLTVELFVMEMEDAGVPREQLAHSKRGVMSALNQQRTLLQDMRDSAMLETGTMVLQPRESSMPDMLEQVMLVLWPRYEQKHCEVITHIADDIPPVWCDPDRIRRVLFNVLENALRYTSAYHENLGDNGQVTVSLFPRGAVVVCEVRDNGRGIAPEQLDQLGQRFLRLARGEQDPEGMGIGLYFCMGIVRLSNGTLDIDSAGEGQGTTVTITLPIAGMEGGP